MRLRGFILQLPSFFMSLNFVIADIAVKFSFPIVVNASFFVVPFSALPAGLIY